jgi:hypothetical protein
MSNAPNAYNITNDLGKIFRLENMYVPAMFTRVYKILPTPE